MHVYIEINPTVKIVYFQTENLTKKFAQARNPTRKQNWKILKKENL